ncbi:MAG: glycosyltransferase family 39 protein [Coleofasciculus sp. S288]|nr:glycosyltransferase family 39 protein [Coleofasciculus sp. S288]
MKRANYFSLPEILSIIIITFGILVRLVQYLFNRSLWADEAVLALNIVDRSFLGLLQPLDYEQGAPIGFLMVEKLAINLFGNNEYALRLFPLLSGIISLFLFYGLAKRFLERQAVPIALAFFASLYYLVYFSFEVKQYSTDVAVALLCCLMAMHLGSPKLKSDQTITFSLAGAIAIWFSHPAIFVLTGVGITSVLIRIVRREKLRLNRIAVIFSSWLFSFAAFYWLSLRSLSGNEDLMTSWEDAFPSSPFDIIWLLDAFGKFFYRPLGFQEIMDGLAIISFVVGCIACYRRKKETLWLLLSPVIVTFFAAYLQKYPFRSRLVLFLTPFVILLMAEGIDYLMRRVRSKPINIAGIVLLVVLLYSPVVDSSKLLVQPYWREEIKPIISYVKTRQQPGDVLYIFQRGEYQFKYYAEKYGYQEGDYIIGVDDLDKQDGKRHLSDAERERYQKDLDKLRGNKRVWLLFSHANVDSENEMVKTYLDSIGKQVDFFERPGAFVYLYDLT